MRVLLLGQGAREHALAWKLSQSPLLTKLFCAPGNVGTARYAENVSLSAEDSRAVAEWAQNANIDLCVVGPEAPLVAGVADALALKNIPTFGPSAAAARLEGSKAFAKDVMKHAGVPTAAYALVHSFEEAEALARKSQAIVIKADGLAAGKGVVVARNASEAVSAVQDLRALKGAASTLLFEELLEGEEVSVMALCDGERFVLLPPAQDHKRLLDGDLGPNTGGMGAYAPAPCLSLEAQKEVAEKVFQPTLAELRRRGIPFRGALYAGLMLTPQGIRVLEFNCRLGDPEAQVLMMQVEEDVLPIFDACAKGALSKTSLQLKPGFSVGIVLAAAGYPSAVRLGDEIEGWNMSSDEVPVFLAGVTQSGQRLLTHGGRVMTVCARGDNMAQALERAYQRVNKTNFDGLQYRKDIGARAL